MMRRMSLVVGIFWFAHAPAATAQPGSSAVASGPCSSAINASGSSIVTIRQVCNYGTLTAAQKKVIDRLVAQAQATAASIKSVKISDAQQSAALQKLGTSDANQSSLLGTIAISNQSQDQQLADLRDRIAAIYQLFAQLAAAPGASNDVKAASAGLDRGEVASAVRVLGEEAVAAAKPGASPTRAAALFTEQAALLQTKSIPDARKALDEALKLDPENVLALNNAAILANLVGDTKRAIELNKQLVGIARGRVAKDPNDAIAQRDLAVALGGLGYVAYNSSDYAAADASYAESLGLIESLCTRDPTSQEWQRLLGFAYANISDVQLVKGETVRALESAEKSLKIAIQFAAQFPGDSSRYEVVARYTRVGDLQSLLGRSDAALAALQKARALLEPIIAANPHVDAGYLDLLNICTKAGYYHLTRGDFDAAIESYSEAVDVAAARAARDPSNVYWKRSLAIGYGGLGDAQLSRPLLTPADTSRVTGEALISYDRSLKLFEEIGALDAGNQLWQYDRWYAQSRLGRARALRGENLVALQHINEALSLMRALTAASPGLPAYKRQLGVTLFAVGTVKLAQGNRAGALTSLREALEQAEKVASTEPDVVEYQRDLALYTGMIAQVQFAEGDMPGSIATFRKTIDLRRQIAASDPANGQWQVDLAYVYMALGTTPGVAPSEQRTTLQAALATLERHIAAGSAPAVPPASVQFVKDRLAALGPASP